jgi:hypothetical protein
MYIHNWYFLEILRTSAHFRITLPNSWQETPDLMRRSAHPIDGSDHIANITVDTEHH